MSPPNFNDLSWRREIAGLDYLITTRPSLLDHAFINRAFDSEDMHWARPLSTEELTITLTQSITLGLYKAASSNLDAASMDEPSSPRTPSPTLEDSEQESLAQIGLARLITDRMTFAYLTDVYILPAERGGGLGKWLIAAVGDVLQMHPAMRRAMLLTGSDVTAALYAKELGFIDMIEEREHVKVMSRRNVL